MRYALLVLTTLLLTSTAFAQETVTVNLTVTSSYDHTPVADATARLLLDGEIKAEAQTGADGTAVLNWSSVNIPNGHEIPSDFEITALYPNPVTSQATVEVANRHERAVTVGIYDVLGRQVTSRSINLTEGISRVPLQAGLAYGVYFVRFSGGGIDHTRSFLSTGRQGAVMVGAPQWVGSLEQTETVTQVPVPLDTGAWEVTVERVGFEPYSTQIDPIQDVGLQISLQQQVANVQVLSYVGYIPESLTPFIIVGSDTLYSSSGLFEHIPAGQTIRAGFEKEGEPFSYLTQVLLTQEMHEVFVIDRYTRLIDGSVDGVLDLEGEIGTAANMTGFRHWNVITHYESNAGILRWNMNPDIIPTAPGTFNGFREGMQGIVPDEVWLAHTYYNIITLDQTSHLTPHLRNIILQEYETYIRPILGEDRQIVEVDSVSFSAFVNQHLNRLLILPWSHTPSGVWGRLRIYGWEPDVIGNVRVELRSKESDPDNSQVNNALIKAFHEEVFGGVGFYNAISADPDNSPDITLPHESVTYDGQNQVIRPTVYDIKRARIANRFSDGMIDDVFIMPGMD